MGDLSIKYPTPYSIYLRGTIPSFMTHLFSAARVAGLALGGCPLLPSFRSIVFMHACYGLGFGF